MAAHRTRRLQKEIQDILKDTLSGITITSQNNTTEITDFTRLKGHFDGPPDTPYEGGHYEVDIHITPEYPFKPPQMKFITKIWHPNVSSQTGAICLDTLGTQWSPVLTVKSALISLQSLLSSPEPKDPQDAAREWAQRYAGAPKPPPGSAKSGAGSSGDATAGAQQAKKMEDKEAKKREEQRRREAYHGYNRNMIDRFTGMGFEVPTVVAAFEYVGIDKNQGEEYELEEEYIGDVTARLFGEM